MLYLYKDIQNSLSALEQALRIGISNADNFNTPGFKYTFTSFTTVYNRVLQSGFENKNPQVAGAGMTVGSTSTDFSQGNIGFGTKMDVAISGEGLFILSKSTRGFENSADRVYTRTGRFQVDRANKYIVDSFGRKVFGFKVNENGDPVSNTLVPIETDGELDIGFVEGGVLVANHTNEGAQRPMYRLAMTTFTNKQGLVISNGAAFRPTFAAGEAVEAGISAEGTYGSILSNSLESSNIDVAKVALDMNQLNRGFSAVQGVVDDINKIFSGLISKLSAG